MHRKPSMIRKALRRLAALLPSLAVTAGAVLATAGTAQAGTYHDHHAANVKACAAFHRWTDTGGPDATAGTWARYLPGTITWLYRDGRALAWAIESDAPGVVKRLAFDDLWADCSVI